MTNRNEFKLLNYSVRVNEEGLLCITDLKHIYGNIQPLKKWRFELINEFFETNETIAYIIELLDMQGLFSEGRHDKKEFISLINTKSINEYKTVGRWSDRATYCNPYIFVAAARWLNFYFLEHVSSFVSDSLIIDRIAAGYRYSKLLTVVTKYIKVPDYISFVNKIHKKITGKHENNYNRALSKVNAVISARIETEIIMRIKHGDINSYEDADNYINNFNSSF